MFEVMALNAYAAFAASVVPTPGNSGAMEGLITMAFSAMAGATLMWVIFTWRFAVYYIYIIIGVGLTVFNFLRNVVRSRRAAKQQQLSSENALPAKTDTSQRSVQVIVDEDTVSSTQTAENQLSSEEKATSSKCRNTRQTKSDCFLLISCLTTTQKTSQLRRFFILQCKQGFAVSVF